MKIIRFFDIFFALLCLVLLPNAQAVNPPPDGGYPGFNTAEGTNALKNLTTGVGDTALGWFSLFSNTDGSFNTGVGAGTLLFNVGDQSTGAGISNTAIGTAALLSNTTGRRNTATGVQSLFSNTSGNFNTANGDGALLSNTTGGSNTAVGVNALRFNTTGVINTALGVDAGVNLTTGDFNIDIGNVGVADESRTIRIGEAQLQTRTFIAAIRGVTTGVADAVPVLIDSDGQLGTASSSRRFKHDIKPMDQTSESILALKPVTFRYKSHTSSTPQFGLIAEEVAAVNPDLVVCDETGEIYTVRYDAVNAMLLNEFLKEHRRVEEQDRKIREQQITITDLKKEMETVVARLNEQEAKIQRVNDQLEMSSSATRAVVNIQ